VCPYVGGCDYDATKIELAINLKTAKALGLKRDTLSIQRRDKNPAAQPLGGVERGTPDANEHVPWAH
jgi:hypothetical protein